MTASLMDGTALFIAPYALDNVLSIYCRHGLSVIELGCWWYELSLDYGVDLVASNQNTAAFSDERASRLSGETGHKLSGAKAYT
ncbi:MAG: hypothetical protein ACR2RF_10560 [Geminicoccaceae bacterium]